jgi:hypothetical protein
MRKMTLAMVLWLAAASLLMAQGRTDYMNVESPQVHPIEVVRVAGHDFIVACNTRNSTIEIFDTDEGAADQKLFIFPLEDPILDKPIPGQFNPIDWNWIYVFVLNADGNFGEGGWQRLALE